MPVTLRKRPAPAPAAAPPAKKKAPAKAKEAPAKAKAAPKAAAPAAAAAPEPKKEAAPAKASSGDKAPQVGDKITLEGFGGEVETNDGEKTTLAKLVADSEAGVVLFTYPAASTPGCTKQVCFFRDAYTELTSTGLKIYGLSKDSPKANTNFKVKQNLPYPLLCDPSLTLIKAIGLKKAPSGTQRGVFVVDKEGKVLIAEPGGPAPTMEAVKKLVTAKKEEGSNGVEKKKKEEEETKA